MGLLAPLFLLGAAAIGLPFWLHRLEAQSSERKPFSSAMLLEPSERRVHVRKKLKYLYLLALRVGLLLALALVFAKPVLTRSPAILGPAPDGTHLVLVDASASMGRRDVFAEAIEAARGAIDSAPRGAVLQVLAADDRLHAVSELADDRASHRASLAAIEPTALRLDFGSAMDAVDRLAESLPAPVTLHFVSDFQASGLPTRFADLVVPHVSSLVTHVVGERPGDNWSVDFLRENAGGIEVGIVGPADTERQISAELLLDGVVAGRSSETIAGSGSIRFDRPELEEGDNRVEVSIDTGDELMIDDRRFVVVENTPASPVPILTFDVGGLPVTYLTAALEAAVTGAYRVEPAIIGEFETRTLSRHRWVIVDDAGAIGGELGQALADYVSDGGNLLMFAGLRSATLTTLPVIDNTVQAASAGRPIGPFLKVSQVDTSHPLVSRTRGWYGINVSQSLPVAARPDDEVLIRLDNGEPFLLERRLGQGRVLFLAGDLETRWNDLPLRPVFAGFVVEAARYLAGRDELSKSMLSGATLLLGRSGRASGQVIGPAGDPLLALVDTTRAQHVRLDVPGFYEVYTPEADYIVAVNPDRRESELRPADGQVLERWRRATLGGTPASTVMPDATAPRRIELWHALLVILALLVIGESVLANTYFAPRTAAGQGNQ